MQQKADNPRRVLVTGATGNQSGALARILLERGHHVRAFTRDTGSAACRELEALGAEPVAGDFGDRDSIERALAGVDALFAMATPFEAGVEEEARQGIALAEAAEAAGVGHLVYSSVAGADQDTGIPHFDSKREVERRIEESGVRWRRCARRWARISR